MAKAKAKDAERRAADKLIAMFEARILDGSLKDGDPLPPEREIVQTYNVSRTVVREAVLALANKGLVDARPRFRPVVREPSYDAAVQAIASVTARYIATSEGVKNIFDVRIMMESSLVRTAATQADRSHLLHLKEALSANEAAIHDSDRFYATDVAFHAVLYQIPDNPILPSIHRAYTDWLSQHWEQMPRLPERNKANHAAHARIFEAILMRDPDAAEEALRDHLDDAWAQVRRTFGPEV